LVPTTRAPRWAFFLDFVRLERTYGHHHPDYMRTAAQAITSKQSQNVSLVIPLVKPETGSAKRQKS
jgi:hypothetical protein